jgi:hypothetical protein
MKEKIPLSVAIITKNEAENLPACLNTVLFAEQIVRLFKDGRGRMADVEVHAVIIVEGLIKEFRALTDHNVSCF